MTIKAILNKIKIHNSTYLFLLLAIMTGNFHSVFLVSILLIGHECGHFFTAHLLHWKTDKIVFYPFGGVAKFSSDINRPLKEELLVLIMGPVVQCFLYALLLRCPFSLSQLNLLTLIHYQVLFFNLLPIYPLDGGRILQCLSCYAIPYITSFQFIYAVSYLMILLFLLLGTLFPSLSFLFILLLLTSKLYQESKKTKYYIERFFLERYLHTYNFKRRKWVNKIASFKRDCYHYIKDGNKYIEEKEYLKSKYYYQK